MFFERVWTEACTSAFLPAFWRRRWNDGSLLTVGYAAAYIHGDQMERKRKETCPPRPRGELENEQVQFLLATIRIDRCVVEMIIRSCRPTASNSHASAATTNVLTNYIRCYAKDEQYSTAIEKAVRRVFILFRQVYVFSARASPIFKPKNMDSEQACNVTQRGTVFLSSRHPPERR